MEKKHICHPTNVVDHLLFLSASVQYIQDGSCVFFFHHLLVSVVFIDVLTKSCKNFVEIFFTSSVNFL